MTRVNVNPWLFKLIMKFCKKTGQLYIYYYDSTAEIVEAIINWHNYAFVLTGNGFERIYLNAVIERTRIWTNLQGLLTDPKFYVPNLSGEIGFRLTHQERQVLSELLKGPPELRKSEFKSATYLLLKAMFGMRTQHVEYYGKKLH